MEHRDRLEKAVSEARSAVYEHFTTRNEIEYLEAYKKLLMEEHMGLPHEKKYEAYQEKQHEHRTASDPMDLHLRRLELQIHEHLLEIRGGDEELVGI